MLISRLRLHGRVLYSRLARLYPTKWFGWQYPRRLTPVSVVPYWAMEFFFLLRAQGEARARGPLVLLVHFISLDVVVADVFRRLFGCKVVLYGIGTDVHGPLPHAGRRFLAWAVSRADSVVCVNSELKREIARAGRGDAVVLPTPFEGGPEPAAGGPAAFDVVTVGNVIPSKEQEALVRALKCVRVPVRAAVVGDGPLKPRLMELARETGVDVRFLGAVEHSRVWGILGESRVYVHTCAVEGVPAAVLEAIWCGLPVIAVEGAYLRDLVEEYGFDITVVPRGSPELLGEAIENALANYDERRAAGRSNREKLEGYQVMWDRRIGDVLLSARLGKPTSRT